MVDSWPYSENQTVEKYIYVVVPTAIDHASKSSHNELLADLPVWDSLKKQKTKQAFWFFILFNF